MKNLFSLRLAILSIFTFIVFGFQGDFAWAQSKSLCPDKVLDGGKIEGIYAGTDCGDMCYATIVMDNGEEFTLLHDEEEAEKNFGDVGNKVSVEYEISQYWNDYGGEGNCARDPILKSSEILVVGADPKIKQEMERKEKEEAEMWAQAQAEPKQATNSINEGFRGVPWNIKYTEAENYGLSPIDTSGDYLRYKNENENLSLGDVPLYSIRYEFIGYGKAEGDGIWTVRKRDGYIFQRVVIYAKSEYFQNLADECVKLFGNPIIQTRQSLEWEIGNVGIKYELENTSVTINFKTENTPKRGGGL